MERISVKTIVPIRSEIGLKYIIVIIDTFTRYVELIPKQEVTAIAAAVDGDTYVALRHR